MKIDLGPAIPEGEWQAVIYNVTETVSKAGQPMLIWEFQLFSNLSLKVFTMLPPNYDGRLKQLLEIVYDKSITGGVLFEPADALGKRLLVQVVHRVSKDPNTGEAFIRADAKSFKPLPLQDPLEE